MRESPYHCVILTETWLDTQIASSELFGPDFTVYRTDRSAENSSKTRGGGVLIAVRRSLCSGLLVDAMNDSLEQLWVTVTSNEWKIVIYIPPNLRNEVDIIDRHISSVDKAISTLNINDGILLFGDYNRPGLCWSMHPQANYLFVDAACSSVNVGSSHLLDGMAYHSLHQINPVCNQNGRFLDLIFANKQIMPACSVSAALESLCNVDIHHPPLMVTVNRTVKVLLSQEFDSTSFDFRRGDYDAINTFLGSANLTSLVNCDNVNNAVSRFIEKIQELIQHHVPRARPRPKPIWGNSTEQKCK